MKVFSHARVKKKTNRLKTEGFQISHCSYYCLFSSDIIAVKVLGFVFANIVRVIRPTVTKLYSGSKKLRSSCSGNLASDWLRAESSPVDEEERKKEDLSRRKLSCNRSFARLSAGSDISLGSSRLLHSEDRLKPVLNWANIGSRT